MTLLVWPVLAFVALWALVRLGRQGEREGRRNWRVTATIFSAVLLAGAAFSAARGGWVLALVLGGAGLWLTFASRLPGVRRSPTEAPMSLSQARSILGVTAEASEADIQVAWKRLMARAHPDQGGSDGLAAQLNAARDRLLKG